MRNISFALTTEQVRNQTKTVTRRTGWKTLKPGTLLQPVVKGMGLKKGERVKKIGGPIRVVSVRRERLDAMLLVGEAHRIQQPETIAEGFPMLCPAAFVSMFCDHNGCEQWDEVTRIEFDYTEPPSRPQPEGGK